MTKVFSLTILWPESYEPPKKKREEDDGELSGDDYDSGDAISGPGHAHHIGGHVQSGGSTTGGGGGKITTAADKSRGASSSSTAHSSPGGAAAAACDDALARRAAAHAAGMYPHTPLSFFAPSHLEHFRIFSGAWSISGAAR